MWLKEQMTLGFLFSDDLNKVLLIWKDSPDWQKGFLNGVGGHFEDFDNTLEQTMVREFQEEAGILIKDWRSFAEMYSDNWFIRVFCSTAPLEILEQSVVVSKNMKEKTDICLVGAVSYYPVVNNARWLIPAAVDFISNNYTFNKISVRYDK